MHYRAVVLVLAATPSATAWLPPLARPAAFSAPGHCSATHARMTGLAEPPVNEALPRTLPKTAAPATLDADSDAFGAGAPSVLLLCCAIAALCALDRVVMSVEILPMAQQYAYSDSQRGLIAAAFSFGYCLALAPAGVAATTTSPKTVLLGGLVLWSAAQATTPAAAAAGFPALLAARAAMGVGEAAAIPSLQAVAANFVPAGRRSAFWGVLTASLSAGTIAAYLITPPLISERGWEFVFLSFGGLGGVLALLWAAWGAAAPVSEASADEAAGADAEVESSVDVPWQRIASSRPVWALTAAHASTNTFMYFGLSWLPTFFNYQFGLATGDASTASLLPFVAGAAGSLSAGAACDALVRRGGLSLTRARKAMTAVACAGPALCMVVLACLEEGVGGLQLSRDEAEALFVFAVGSSSFSAAGYGCAAQDISKRLSSLIYGASSVFAVVAGASGQWLTGQLLETNGRDFSPVFLGAAAVELAGLVGFWLWWDSEREFD